MFKIVDEGGDKKRQVGGGPVALHVAFPEADFAIGQDAREKLVVVDVKFSTRSRCRLSEVHDRLIRKGDAQGRAVEALHKIDDQPACPALNDRWVHL